MWYYCCSTDVTDGSVGFSLELVLGLDRELTRAGKGLKDTNIVERFVWISLESSGSKQGREDDLHRAPRTKHQQCSHSILFRASHVRTWIIELYFVEDNSRFFIHFFRLLFIFSIIAIVVLFIG